MSGGFVIDNPDRTKMRHISLYHRLKLEVKTPGGPTWRVSPSKMIRAEMISLGLPDPGRTKKKVYNAFGEYLVEQGTIQNHEPIK